MPSLTPVLLRVIFTQATSRYEHQPHLVWWERPGYPTTPTSNNTLATVAVRVDSADQAAGQIGALAAAYASHVAPSRPKYGTLFMGDFGVCDATAQSLLDPATFSWHIPDDDDTTVSADTSCAYDRFVGAGELGSLLRAFSSKPYRFDRYFSEVYGPSVIGALSDRYPIELELDTTLAKDVKPAASRSALLRVPRPVVACCD